MTILDDYLLDIKRARDGHELSTAYEVAWDTFNDNESLAKIDQAYLDQLEYFCESFDHD